MILIECADLTLAPQQFKFILSEHTSKISGLLWRHRSNPYILCVIKTKQDGGRWWKRWPCCQEDYSTGSLETEVGLPNSLLQVEYYFGDFNLPRDKFLQEETKSDDGWVNAWILFFSVCILNISPLQCSRFTALLRIILCLGYHGDHVEVQAAIWVIQGNLVCSELNFLGCW